MFPVLFPLYHFDFITAYLAVLVATFGGLQSRFFTARAVVELFHPPQPVPAVDYPVNVGLGFFNGRINPPAVNV